MQFIPIAVIIPRVKYSKYIFVTIEDKINPIKRKIAPILKVFLPPYLVTKYPRIGLEIPYTSKVKEKVIDVNDFEEWKKSPIATKNKLNEYCNPKHIPIAQKQVKTIFFIRKEQISRFKKIVKKYIFIFDFFYDIYQ